MVDKLYKLKKTTTDIEDLLCTHKNLIYHMLTEMQLLHNQNAESAGWQGLWDAINTFDIFSENQFSTYACVVIKNAILTQLRKDKAKEDKLNTTEYAVLCECYTTTDFQEDESLKEIYKLFDAYIATRKGVTKNVLLAWYSMDFCTSAANLAIICKCSSSYVSRVQSAFRAYIDTNLRK